MKIGSLVSSISREAGGLLEGVRGLAKARGKQGKNKSSAKVARHGSSGFIAVVSAAVLVTT